MTNLHEQNARVISAAADRILERGWFRLGDPTSDPSAECAYIALAMAASDANADFFAVLQAFDEPLDEQAIDRWNDAQRSADVVIATMQRVAAIELAAA